MKHNNINILYYLLCLTLLMACSNSSVTDPMKNIEQYATIYIKQAANYPNKVQVNITDDEQLVYLNACLGGYISNHQDIKITFEIRPDLVDEYNSKNNTDYPVLGAQAYQLTENEVQIKSGELNSGKVYLSLHTKGHAEAGKPYMLPISISSVDKNIPVNENLQTAYFLFTGEYPLGEEPPVQVFDATGKTIKNLFTFHNDLVVIEPNLQDGAMRFYLYDAETEMFSGYRGTLWYSWDAFVWTISYTDAILACQPDGTLIWYSWDKNTGNVISWLGPLGHGFNTYDKVISSINHKGLFCVAPNGKMTYLPIVGVNSLGTAIEMNTGWNIYTQILSYGSDILAIDAAGDLWLFPVDAQKNVGEKKKIGSGWNKYSHVTAFGNDLLTLGADGIVWKYNFNKNGFWDITNN